MLKGRSDSVSLGSLVVHKVLFVPSKNLFPQSCVSSGGSMVGLMVTSSNNTYAIPRPIAPRAPTPAGDTQTLKGRLSLCGVSWYAQRFYLSPQSISGVYGV